MGAIGVEERSVNLPPVVLGISPGTASAAEARQVLRAVEAALGGGLRGVLLREPALDERAYLELARAVRARLDACEGGWLGVHDRVHLAALAGADGVHLGFRSLAPRELPEFARDLCVGLSAHAADGEARWEGADYLTFGPVADTPSKRGVLEPVGLDGLAEGVRRAGATPVWALGGLRPEDAAACLARGARGVAAIGGLLGSPDPGDAAGRFAAALAGGAA